MTMTPLVTWRPPSEFADDLRERYGLTCPPLWGTPRRPGFKSLGPAAWRVMEALGYPPMPWQKYVLDVALEIDPVTGTFVHREVGLSVSRQQGKTQQILALMVHRIAAWQRQTVIYAAQTRGMARTRWEDEFLATMDDSSIAGRYRVRKTNGHEAIIWSKTRSKLGITANTEKAGHGPALDLGVIDEAFAHEDDRLEQAFSPAMLTKPMAQLWWASAGGTDRSVWLNKKREQGRALIEQMWATGEYPSVAYFEWFAPEDMPRDDPETWRFCLPALGYTVSEDIIRSELDKMAGDPSAFDRAYLNRTRKAVPPSDPNIPREAWAVAVDRESCPGTDLAFAIDVAQDRKHASIGVASLRPDGLFHLELVDRRPGTDWVVPAITRLREIHDPVAVAVASYGAPAASLIDDLVAAGIEVPKNPERPARGDLSILRVHDLTEACGQITDTLIQGGARHIDQRELTGAVNAARTRRQGDAWTLDRTNSPVDIAPLCAVTFARWALMVRLPLVQEYDLTASIF
ncbi:terminase [Streptomyces sp. SID13726]|nr:terminase [Streptomyces sp. SID13726]